MSHVFLALVFDYFYDHASNSTKT